jgi:hypothetical protein
MQTLLVSTLAAVALGTAALPAAATVLTFEDLAPQVATGFDPMPQPYAGFSFNNWYFGPDPVFTPASGTIDLFTDFADPNDPGAYVITRNNAVSRAQAFVFDGAWFSGYSGVQFELWLGAALVHSSATLADAADATPYGPTFLASGYGGPVDRVVVAGVQGYFAMDDFSWRNAAAVPAPGTLLLVASALLLLMPRARTASSN